MTTTDTLTGIIAFLVIAPAGWFALHGVGRLTDWAVDRFGR